MQHYWNDEIRRSYLYIVRMDSIPSNGHSFNPCLRKSTSIQPAVADIHRRDSGSPKDIILSEKANCLYVNDETWIYKIDLELCQVIRWQSFTNFENNLMSISNEGDLISLSVTDSSYYYRQLDVYRPDAVRTWSFLLQGVLGARQAIETPDEDFIIIREYREVVYTPVRRSTEGLCLVNSLGKQSKLQSFTDSRKYWGHIHRLFVSTENRRLYVFYYNEYNYQHILASLDVETLRRKHDLLTIYTDCDRSVIAWYEDTNEQFIAGCNGNIKVYKIIIQ